MTQDHDDIDIDLPQPPPDRLYAHNRRQLSAMLDGELSPDQARFMLRRLQHDTELAACWERWQVCGDVLRGRGHALLPADFSRRVAAAIAAPADEAAGMRDAPARARRPHGLLRWGGGALAASVALVALFMARQLPDTAAPAMVEANIAARSAPASADGAPGSEAAPALADAAGAPAASEPGRDAAALLAAAAPVVVAAVERPRRAPDRMTTRSQAQRASLRRTQAGDAERQLAVATAPRAIDDRSSAMGVPGPGFVATVQAAGAEGDALFGGPPAASRPWPRAVLPGLPSGQPFAAGYGLPQAEAFAPFHPRLEAGRRIQPVVAPFPDAGPAHDAEAGPPPPDH